MKVRTAIEESFYRVFGLMMFPQMFVKFSGSVEKALEIAASHSVNAPRNDGGMEKALEIAASHSVNAPRNDGIGLVLGKNGIIVKILNVFFDGGCHA